MFRRILEDVRPHGRYAIGVLGCTLIYSGARIAPALLARTLLDTTLRGRPTILLGLNLDPRAAVVAVPTLILMLAGLLAGTQYLMRLWAGVLGQRLIGDLQVRLFEHLLRSPIPSLESRALGRHLVRFGGDMHAVRRSVSRSIPEIVRDAVAVIAIGATLIHLSASLAIPIIAVIVAYVAAVGLAWRQLQPASRAVRTERARIAGIALDRLAIASTVKLASRERAEAKRLERAQHPVLAATLRTARLSGLISGAAEMAVGLAVAASLGLGTRAVIAGTISRGEMVAFYGLALLLFSPMRTLGRTVESLAHGRVAFERLYGVLEQPVESDPHGAEPLEVHRGEIVATGLQVGGFAFPNLRLEPGVTAVVGGPGSRKTNLGHLLVRLRHAETGRLAIDGTDISRVTLGSLRREVMYIAYPPSLLKGSLRMNLRAGAQGVADGAIVTALRAVGADWADPLALQMKVGSGGHRLSGTQRWQVLCARALVARPAILVLDGVPYEGPPLDTVLRRMRQAGIRSVLILVDRPLASELVARTARIDARPVAAGA